MQQSSICGGIPDILRNNESLYEGNLIHYFRAIFNNAQNLWNPYHNFNHMFHTLWLCHRACVFYGNELSPREMRNLLIAAIFHDFDHSGIMGNDGLNIERSIRGLQKYIAQEDKVDLGSICDIIRATEFPHKVLSGSCPLLFGIIRDADLAQALDVTWIQQVVFGLAKEWGKKPIEILDGQEAFLSGIKFNTDWARQMFPRKAIESKIFEVREL